MPQSNIYSASADEMRVVFDEYLSGPESCVVMALSARPLDAVARNAIGKSLESFGYGEDACTFATLFPKDGGLALESEGADGEGAGIGLDAQALFLLVEALDPVCLICADAESAAVLGEAYRVSYGMDTPARVFGRSAVVFRDFAAMLQTDGGKQQAWRLLKSLPKR